MSDEITMMLLKLFFIYTFEALFIVSYILIKSNKNIFRIENLVTSVLVGIISLNFFTGITPLTFLVERIVYMFIVSSFIYIFHTNEEDCSFHEIYRYSLSALILFFIVESLVAFPMTAFIGIDFKNAGIVLLILYSIPARIMQAITILLINKKKNGKKEKEMKQKAKKFFKGIVDAIKLLFSKDSETKKSASLFWFYEGDLKSYMIQ